MSRPVSKNVTMKLFYNLSSHAFYIQLNDMLFMVRDSIVAAIQEKEGLEIRHVADVKQIQQLNFEDGK